MAKMNPALVDNLRAGSGQDNGFRARIRDTGAFRVEAIKARSAVEQYTTALQKQDVTFRNWHKNAGLRTAALKEQYALQRAMAIGWKEDAYGRMSADMIIPRGAPERIGNFRKTLDAARTGTISWGTALSETRMRIGMWSQAVQSASHNLVNWGKNTQWAGRQMMVGLTLPFAALAAGTAALAYSMDKELTKIVKVYDFVGDNVTAQTKRLREDSMETAKMMAKQYAQSAKDTLSVTASLAATGQTGPGLQRSTKTVARAMFLGDLNKDDAIKAAITLQTVYAKVGEKSIDANKRLSESFDYLNALENQTALSMQDMVIAIPKLAGVTKSLGGDVQDIGTMMAAAKAAGLDAAEGANMLKTIMFRAVSPYGKGKATFLEKTNIDLTELVKTTNGEAIPTFVKMAEAMRGLGQVERAAVLKDVFGVYQGSKGGQFIDQMIQLGDATTQTGRAFQLAQEGAEEWAAIREKEEKAMRNSASGKFKIALESIKVELAELGKTFLPIATGILGFIGKIVSGFNSLGGTSKTIMLVGLAIGAIIGPVVMITGVLATLIATIIRSSATLLSFASRFRAVNADQQAAKLLANQTSLAWKDQGLAAAMLAKEINTLTASLTTLGMTASQKSIAAAQMASRNIIAGTGIAPTGTRVVGTKTPKKAYGDSSARASEAVRSSATNSAVIAQNADQAKRSFRGAALGAAALAGTIGILASGTSKWVNYISIALISLPALLPLLSAIKASAAFTTMSAGIKAAGVAVAGRVGLAGKFAGLGKVMSGLPALMGPLGIALAAAGAGAALLYFHMKKVRKEAEGLSKAGDAIAKAMGETPLAAGQFVDENGSVQDTVTSRVEELKKNSEATYKALQKLGQGAGTARGDQAIRDRVIKVGLDVYSATKDADKAKQAVDVALAAAGNPKIKIDLDFENDNWRAEIQQKLTEGLVEASRKSYETDGLFDVGMDDAVKVQLEEKANDLADLFGEFQGGQIDLDALKAQFKAVGDAYVDGTEEVYRRYKDQLSKNSRSKIESFGIDPDDTRAVAQALLTNEKFRQEMRYGTRDTKNLAIDTKGLSEGYQYLSKKTVEATNTQNLDGVSKRDLVSVTNNLTTTNGAAASSTDGLGAAAAEAMGGIDGLTGSVESLSEAEKKAMEVQKNAMGTVWSGIMEMADQQLSDRHERATQEIEAGGKRRTDSIEAEAKKQGKIYDQQSKDMDKRHNKESKDLDDKQKTNRERIEEAYDARIKAIEDVTEAETKADELRQKMFEAEKARIQRLADMYNQNIDFNVALNSGNMDEAAKIANNMRATQEQWAVDDAAASGTDALAQANEKRQGDVDKIKGEKDARLKTLDGEEEAAKQRLKDRQDAEKEALDAEKERYNDSVNARKEAEDKKTKAAVDGSNKRYEAEKKSLDLALARLRVMTPKNEQEIQQYTNAMAKIYEDHGYKLDTKSKEWADYVARSMRSAADTAREQLADEAKWNQIGSDIGDALAEGMLGMSFDDFLTWMQTGKMPEKPKTPPQDPNKPGGSTYNAQVPRQAANATPGSPGTSLYNSQVPHHGGGVIGSGGTGRAGRPLTANLYSDEVPIIGQKGEFVMQRSAVNQIGLKNLHAMNNGVFRHKGGLVGAIGAMAGGMLRKGVAKAMQIGVDRVGGAPGGTLPVGNYPSAIPPGEDGFASWLTEAQRQVEPGVLSKVWAALARIPGSQKIISGFRPGAIVAGTNRPSLHGFGKAVDIGADAYDPAGSAMGDAIAKLFRSGAVPGVSEVLWKTMKGGNHFDHVHVGFRHGGGPIGVPGMKIGGNIKYDNTIANLHRGEKVLTAPLSSALERGINNLDGAGNVTYDILMDFRGAMIREDVDIEKAVTKVLNNKESKLGRKRVIK